MSATEQVFAALQASYVDLAVSVPLVALGIAITGSIFYLAAVRPRVTDKSLSAWMGYLLPRQQYNTTSARVDRWVWVINGLLVIPVYQVCVVIAGMIVGTGFNEILASAFGPAGRTVDFSLAVILQFLGFYFGVGLGQYGGHLAFHKIPLLWVLHRAHHSAESPNLFAFLRSHPLEIFLSGAARVTGAGLGIGIAVYATGGMLLAETTTAIFWYNIINVLAGFRSLDHTHIPVRYGKLLDVLIGSPVLHQVHHSAERRHRDVNMAGAGYIYDWLFGTLYIPGTGETWRWGLNEEERGAQNPHQSVRNFFFEPMATLGVELRKILPTRKSDTRGAPRP